MTDSNLVLIGDSNIHFGGGGWAYGFQHCHPNVKTLLWAPGEATSALVDRLIATPGEEVLEIVKPGATVIINSGVNARWWEIISGREAKAWLDLTTILTSIPDVRIVWMPTHHVYILRMKMCRWAIKRNAPDSIDYIDLTEDRYRRITMYNKIGNTPDQNHLVTRSYIYLAKEVIKELKGDDNE